MKPDPRRTPKDQDGRTYHDAILSTKDAAKLAALMRHTRIHAAAAMLGAQDVTLDKLVTGRGCTRPARDRVAAALGRMTL